MLQHPLRAPTIGHATGCPTSAPPVFQAFRDSAVGGRSPSQGCRRPPSLGALNSLARIPGTHRAQRTPLRRSPNAVPPQGSGSSACVSATRTTIADYRRSRRYSSLQVVANERRRDQPVIPHSYFRHLAFHESLGAWARASPGRLALRTPSVDSDQGSMDRIHWASMTMSPPNPRRDGHVATFAVSQVPS